MILIKSHAKLAVESALNKKSGVVGIDDNTNKLKCIDFVNIKGGKPFNHNQPWFQQLLLDYKQK